MDRRAESVLEGAKAKWYASSLLVGVCLAALGDGSDCIAKRWRLKGTKVVPPIQQFAVELCQEWWRWRIMVRGRWWRVDRLRLHAVSARGARARLADVAIHMLDVACGLTSGLPQAMTTFRRRRWRMVPLLEMGSIVVILRIHVVITIVTVRIFMMPRRCVAVHLAWATVFTVACKRTLMECRTLATIVTCTVVGEGAVEDIVAAELNDAILARFARRTQTTIMAIRPENTC